MYNEVLYEEKFEIVKKVDLEMLMNFHVLNLIQSERSIFAIMLCVYVCVYLPVCVVT